MYKLIYKENRLYIYKLGNKTLTTIIRNCYLIYIATQSVFSNKQFIQLSISSNTNFNQLLSWVLALMPTLANQHCSFRYIRYIYYLYYPYYLCSLYCLPASVFQLSSIRFLFHHLPSFFCYLWPHYYSCLQFLVFIRYCLKPI